MLRTAALFITLLLALPGFPAPLRAAEPIVFNEWLEGFRREALNRGISDRTLQAALADIRPVDRVIELDRSQPELTLTYAEYLRRVVPDARVRMAKQKLDENSDLLQAIHKAYGVQPRFLVALWAIETGFGTNRGGFEIIPSLATLAWEGRRREYFEAQLLQALQLVDRGVVTVPEMVGSWAGAMGQLQFMPSTVTSYWVDHNRNGHIDIWEDHAEALASAANYLSRLGWKSNETWGRQVRLPPSLDRNLILKRQPKRIAEWQELGVRRLNGTSLPKRNLKGYLVVPEAKGPAFLVYGNYDRILNWNRSDLFGLAVGRLSDALKTPSR